MSNCCNWFFGFGVLLFGIFIADASFGQTAKKLPSPPGTRLASFYSPTYRASSYRAQPNFSVPEHRLTNVGSQAFSKPPATFYGNRYPEYQSYVGRRQAPVKKYPNYGRRVRYNVQPVVRRSC